MKIVNAAAILLLGAAQLPSAASEPNKQCLALQLLPVLDSSYHECNNGFVNGSCERFADTFRKLTARSDCQRSFDTGPVPAVWLAGDAALEDFVRLLSRLAAKKDTVLTNQWFAKARATARSFFGSDDFRGILDGALAEEYMERSEQVGRELRPAK